MAIGAGGAPTVDGNGLGGLVAGATLAAVRRSVGLDQGTFAERLGVSVKTVQAWEQARNSMTRLPYARLRQIGRTLLAAGASPELVTAWETALVADDILAGLDQRDPDRHPLGLVVPDRATTDMLAWPLTGNVPRALATTTAALHIPAGQRASAAAELRDLAESAPEGAAGSMLRRQAVFLVAEADAAGAAGTGWASEQIRRQVADVDLSHWTPQWAVARSAAIRAAGAGDLEPLRRFASEGLADPSTEAANLRYWAYWAGEMPVPWVSDSQMSHPRADASWSGEMLLPSLLSGVVSAPYRELCAHALWSLARARKSLVTHPGWVSDICDTVEQATTDDTLSRTARKRLEQVHHFLIGSTL